MRTTFAPLITQNLKHMFRSLIIAACFSLCAWALEAQMEMPAPSPAAEIEQTVGLTDIEIEYSRPSMKGRVIFGDLVPYGEMWRTGANKSTQIEFSTDVTINNQPLPKGKYALYTVPGEQNWDVMFYKDLSFWGTPGDKFDEEMVALKTTVPAISLKSAVETFTIDIQNLRDGSADIHIKWANTAISLPLTVGTDDAVMASIDKAMAGPSWRDYYQAGRYYVENGKDAKQALEWMEMATAGEGGEKFWVVRWLAHAQAANNMKAKAIETAMKQKELATAAGNMQYVKFAEQAIAEWKK